MKFEILNVDELEQFVKDRSIALTRPGLGQRYSLMGVREQIAEELEKTPFLEEVHVFLMSIKESKSFIDSDGKPFTTAGFSIDRFVAKVKVHD